jgi:hypothetical protein
MFQESTDDDNLGKSGGDTQLDSNLINLGVSTEGAEAFLDLKDQYNQIENLTVSVDKAMRGLINTMGQGENLSVGIRKNIAIEKEVDYEKLMSEHYANIGKKFLTEAKKRDYTKDTEYESSPKQRHNRVERVLARRFMEKKGLVHKGDGKDVDHKDGDPTNNSPKNLRVMSRSKNRAKQ